MRTFIIIIAALIILTLTSMAGFRALSGHIYERNDCERFNIDNIELRTGIDIPAVNSSECQSDGIIKQSVFVLDTAHFNLEEYLRTYEFTRDNSRYFARGENQNTRWSAVYMPKTQELRVNIKYKDKL